MNRSLRKMGLLILTVTLLSAARHAQQIPAKPNYDIRLTALLHSIPEQFLLNGKDTLLNGVTIEVFTEIAKYDLADIRIAISDYMSPATYIDKATNTEKPYDNQYIPRIGYKYKFYLLNRFLFDVPFELVDDSPTIGGFMWSDNSDKRYRYNPFTLSNDGRTLQIKGDPPSSFSGSAYNPVLEFDYFHKKYGKRKLLR